MIELIIGDIAKQNVDTIVNSANPTLMAGSGISGSIHKLAGKELEQFCLKLGAQEYGSVVRTPRYNLNSMMVFHVVTPRHNPFGPIKKDTVAKLRGCYQKVFDLATEDKIQKIALPILGVGRNNIPLLNSVNILSETLRDHPWLAGGTCIIASTNLNHLNTLQKELDRIGLSYTGSSS